MSLCLGKVGPVIRSHLPVVLVLEHLILNLNAVLARDASDVFIALQISFEVSLEEFLSLHITNVLITISASF